MGDHPGGPNACPSCPGPWQRQCLFDVEGSGNVSTGEQLGSRTLTGADMAWRDHAACRLADVELFFPAGAAGPVLDTINAAKAVCEGCRVRHACLQFALDTNQEAGIWGGVAEDDRRRLRRSWLADRRRRAG